jgi:hypothetical protein
MATPAITAATADDRDTAPHTVIDSGPVQTTPPDRSTSPEPSASPS